LIGSYENASADDNGGSEYFPRGGFSSTIDLGQKTEMVIIVWVVMVTRLLVKLKRNSAIGSQ